MFFCIIQHHSQRSHSSTPEESKPTSGGGISKLQITSTPDNNQSFKFQNNKIFRVGILDIEFCLEYLVLVICDLVGEND